jgi:uncharacterized iron-regulated protein
MENQEQQLVLDFGMLTVAQQERVDSFIKNQKDVLSNKIREGNAIETLLNEGGFRKGIDYENTIKTKIVTGEKEFSYDGFKADITYETVEGNISILYKKYDSITNKIVTQKSYISRNSDKLESSTITPQYRAYKPTTLFEKLVEKNNKAQLDYNNANREQAVIDYTVNKYKTLFPNATVTIGKDYYKTYKNGYVDFSTVIVTFESGSYIIFKLGYENDKEFIHKKFDAVEAKLNAIEILTLYNNQ